VYVGCIADVSEILISPYSRLHLHGAIILKEDLHYDMFQLVILDEMLLQGIQDEKVCFIYTSVF
jgi:hypothetical protein